MTAVRIRSGRRPRNRLSNTAILEISYEPRGVGLSYPPEVGLAFCDGRPPLSWVVVSEDRWRIVADEATLESRTALGAGLPAAVFAHQLRSATMGLRVFAECHMPANAWLKALSSASGISIDVRVRDMRSLIVPARLQADGKLPENFDWAFQRSRRAVPPVSRAVVDALRHAKFLSELLAGDSSS